MGYDPASIAAEIGRSATSALPCSPKESVLSRMRHDALNAARFNRVAVAISDRIAKWNANEYTIRLR
jgi:hypothetical protein